MTLKFEISFQCKHKTIYESDCSPNILYNGQSEKLHLKTIGREEKATSNSLNMRSFLGHFAKLLLPADAWFLQCCVLEGVLTFLSV